MRYYWYLQLRAQNSVDKFCTLKTLHFHTRTHIYTYIYVYKCININTYLHLCTIMSIYIYISALKPATQKYQNLSFSFSLFNKTLLGPKIRGTKKQYQSKHGCVVSSESSFEPESLECALSRLWETFPVFGGTSKASTPSRAGVNRVSPSIHYDRSASKEFNTYPNIPLPFQTGCNWYQANFKLK